MKSASVRFFISSQELEDFLNLVRIKEGLTCILEDFFSGTVATCSPRDPLYVRQGLDRVTLAPGVLDMDDLNHQKLSIIPYEKGWITIDTFIRETDILYMSKMSFRSAVEPANRLFNRLKSALLKLLARGVVVLDVSEGTEQRVDSIFYSPGAMKLEEDGVSWMQFGVRTQRFRPSIAANQPNR